MICMGWTDAFEALDSTVATRAHLLACGATGASLTAAVKAGHLVRCRRDRYTLPSTSERVIRAVRVGGRLACVDALEHMGVYQDQPGLHVHLLREASRVRSPHDGRTRLTARRGDVHTHWAPLLEPDRGDEVCVGLIDALIQAAHCQHPWRALASIENAAYQGLVTDGDLRAIFSAAPARVRALATSFDPRAEAGQETVLRMIVVSAGLACESQVWIDGVGRVDLVVEGCLVLEADSRKAHDGWALHVRDRDRDLALARLGYMSLRPVYQRTLGDPIGVRDAILELVRRYR